MGQLQVAETAGSTVTVKIGSLEIIVDDRCVGSFKIDGIEQKRVQSVVLTLKVGAIPKLEVERMPQMNGKPFILAGFKGNEKEQSDGKA